jgi:hypothetical protein
LHKRAKQIYSRGSKVLNQPPSTGTRYFTQMHGLPLSSSLLFGKAFWSRLYALALLGGATQRLGQHTEAQQHLHEALRLAAETRSFAIVSFALPVIPLLRAEQGEGARAVELYALATSWTPMVSNSPWFEEIAGRHLTAVAASLPREVSAAAQARGRSRDLWATVTELAEELAN